MSLSLLMEVRSIPLHGSFTQLVMEVTLRDGPTQDRAGHSWAKDSEGILMPPHSQNCLRLSFRHPERPPFQLRVLSQRTLQMQRRQCHLKKLRLRRTGSWALCLNPTHKMEKGRTYVTETIIFTLGCSFFARMLEKTCYPKKAHK